MNYNNNFRSGRPSARRIRNAMEIPASAGQKRSRTTQQSNHMNYKHISLSLIGALATTVLFAQPSQAFHFRQATVSSTLDFEQRMGYTSMNRNRKFSHQNRLSALHSTRSSSKSSSSPSSSTGGVVVEAIQPMRPESSTSQKRREAALRQVESSSRTVDSALEGIDAQVLELLSEDFLYPSPGDSQEADQRKGKHVPRLGRPEMVPGAMSWKSMKKYQQERESINQMAENNGGNAAAMRRSEYGAKLAVTSEEVALKEKEVARQREERSRTRGRKKKDEVSRESLPEAAAVDTEDITTSKKKVTRKKRVVKTNLPNERPQKKVQTNKDELYMSEDFVKTQARPGRGRTAGNTYRDNGNNLNLRKYFGTELLTPEEEYDIGEKIQLMIQCEQVHEGLCIKEMRLPTIAEWAVACGYTEEQDNNYPINDILETQIRPVGFETIFDEVDPNMFVGNGLAGNNGVGRGRGREKKPPPSEIPKDVYKIDRKTGKKIGGAKATPVNRGTVEDFCDMMLDGREAKKLMVKSNMRLVISISKKYSNVGVSLYDLVQEGSIGLSRAAEKFDPGKGFKFSTYASWWIQQAVFRSIAYHSRTIRLPVHIHNMLNRVRKVRSNLQQGLGRPPTDEEMAEALDMPASKYKRMIELTKRSVSLETPIYAQNPKDVAKDYDESIGSMASNENKFDGKMDDENISPEKSVDRSLFRDDLKEMLENLNEGERTVIGLRYGIVDGLTRTVTATAAKLNKSPAWVRSQESKGLRKLRRPWYEKKLKEHQKSLLG